MPAMPHDAIVPDALVLAEFRHYPVVPEFALYCAGQAARELGVKDVSVVLVRDESDAEILGRAVAAAEAKGAHRIAVFFWHYWHCLPHGTLETFLGWAAKLRRNPKVVLATGGLHQTLAPELFAASGLFHTVQCGYPWGSWEWASWQGETRILDAPPKTRLDERFSLESGFGHLLNPDRLLRHDPEGRGSGYYLSYGCSNGCAFCWQTTFCRRFHGNLVKPEDLVWRDLEFLHHRCGVELVDVLDSNVLDNPRRGRDFLRRMGERSGLRLYNTLGLRVIDLEPDILELVARAGVQTVFFGLETLDRECQELVGKPFTREALSVALRAADARGLAMEGNLMAGVSSATGRSLDREGLGRMIRDFLPWYAAHPNLRIQLRPYMPYLGTPLGDRLWAGRQDEVQAMGLAGYLRLADRVLFGRSLAGSDLPLPPCYADVETYETVCRAHEAFRSYVAHKASLYHYPPRLPAKAEYLRVLDAHCLRLAGDMCFEFSELLDKGLASLAAWK